MITVVGVRFKHAGKIYYFDPDSLDIKQDDFVIVETARGLEFGQVVIGPRDLGLDQIIQPLKKVIRIATEEDIEKDRENKAMAERAFHICEEEIEKHKLEMRLIECEYTFDNNKVIFYFTAEGRIDFRDLVKDLAAIFRTRIELRQIGVRDQAKMVGGLGPCGRETCCSSFLGDFEPVSIKMAKDQNLSLNPTKISGLCGRLMCCLNYENGVYEELNGRMPAIGTRVMTEEGPGVIEDIYTLLETAKVRVKLEDDTEDIFAFHIDDLKYQKSCPKKDKGCGACKGKKSEKTSIEKDNTDHK